MLKVLAPQSTNVLSTDSSKSKNDIAKSRLSPRSGLEKENAVAKGTVVRGNISRPVSLINKSRKTTATIPFTIYEDPSPNVEAKKPEPLKSIPLKVREPAGTTKSSTKISILSSNGKKSSNQVAPFSVFEDDPCPAVLRTPPNATIKNRATSHLSRKSTKGNLVQRPAQPAENVAEKDDLPIKTENESTLAYWKKLAEERKDGLESALIENKILHATLEAMKKENKFLRNAVEALNELIASSDTVEPNDNTYADPN